MPIFEYNGKKYNVPDDKVEGFKSRKPEATLVNSAPFYLADDSPKVNIEAPDISPVDFNAELMKARQPKVQTGVTLGGGDNTLSDVASDIYDIQKAEKQFKDSLVGQTSELGKDIKDRFQRSMLAETEAKNRKWDEDMQGATASQRAYASQARSAMANKQFDDMPESGNYSVADHYIQESNRIINEAGKNGGNLKAAGRGAKDALFNPDTWAAGLTELDRSRRVEQAVQRYEQGEQLSESEEKMLDALALNLAVNQHYGSDIQRGYKWGQIAGESAPFMVEMVLNPLSASGKGLAKSIANYGIKKLGAKGVGKLAVKAGSRAIGDTVAALGMTATTGAPRTMSDAMSRILGEATYKSEDGTVKYAGHEGGKGVVESVLKSIGSNVLEYQSEMLGSSGLGQVVGKIPGVKAISKAVKASDFGKYVGKMNNSTLYREAKSLGNRAQWNGTIGEYGEEVYNQFMNALFIGDNKMSDLTDIDQQVDTFMGLALTGGAMSSMNTLSYSTDRVVTENKLRKADQQANTLFDGWDEVKSQLSGMSAEERTETLRDVLKRDNISIPAKKAFTDYVSGITYKESLTGAAEAKAVQDAEAGKETGQRLYDTLKDKRSIALSSLNIEKQELEAQLGDLASLPLTEIEESPEATPDIINAARKYNIVKSEFDGVMDRLRSEVDVYVQPQIESLEQVAKDGTITELNIGSSENPETVYLLSGDISFNEDGTVNKEAPLSPTINIKYADERKPRQIGTHHVVSGKVDDLEQTKEAIRQMAYDKYVNPLADKMEGKRHFELNETVEFVDDKGKTVAGKVNGKQGQAVQVLHSDGKTTSTFTESELDQRLIGESLGDVQIRDKFPVNIDGETLDAEVQDISDGKATLYIPNNPVASRRFIEVSLDEINEMRTMSVSGPQEIDKTLENTPQNEGVTVGSIQQNETETAETVSESQNSIEEQAQTVQEFPKDKDGNIDYAKITDNEAYVEALRSEFGDEAHNVVDEYKKAAEKALKGVSKINDPIRKRREQARRQAELDRWNVMFEATRPKAQAPTYEEEYNPILTKNSREREAQMGDYVSLRDFLLRNIGTGKLRFIWNSRDGRKGLKDEILSSKNTNAERLRRIAFLDNNGFTPETLAEFINDNHGQDIPGFSTLDVQDVRNEINDVLLSFDTPTDMIEAAERLRRDDMSLESYTEQNVSPEEIANYEANDVSQNELLLTLPEQETPEISEQELIEYYGNERGIEDIEQYPDTERGVYRGTEKRDQISLQAASDGVEAAEERQAGEQGARDSFAEPDQERAEQAIAGYDNQEDGASGTERKYSAGQRISIDGVDHEISEAGTYVGTNDHFYTLEKDGQPVYEDISEQELDNLINNVAQSGNIINFVENKQDEPNETNEVSQPVSQGIDGAQVEETGRMGEEPRFFQRGFEASIRDAQAIKGTLSEREVADIAESTAKENGRWIPLVEQTQLGEPFPSGMENEVYHNERENAVYKVNNLSLHKNNILSLIERINHHNQLFPDTEYELYGFSGFGNGSVYPILKQKHIPNATFATPQEIDDYMSALGFEPTGKEAEYTNGEFIVSDLRSRNVLKDSDGDLYVIDAGVEKQAAKQRKAFSEYKENKPEIPKWDGKESVADYAQKVVDADKGRKESRAKPIAEKSDKVEKIEDFGEKIGGARKDLAQEYKTKLSEIKEDDIRSKPLSKIFPRLDLKKLVENGDLTQDDALYLNYRYDKIPTKPRDTGGLYQKRKLDKWIKDVQKEIKLAHTILSQVKSFGHLDLLKKIKQQENAGYRYFQNGDEIKVTPEQRLMLNDDWMHIETLKALGFPTSGIKMGNAKLQYRVHSGEQYIVTVNNKRAFHKTFEEAVDYLKKELEKPTKRETVFNIYQNRKSGKYFIGKPIQGKEPVQLSEFFDTDKEVISYFRDHRDEVQAKWDAMSVKPEERRSENRERQGRDWRNGKDVTPEQFQSEFGFRGTEFGNWVNQQERQDALNNAYDALMDLSSVLDISPRSLSLNGELGMAFGARGTGNAGGSTAAAHYESAKVVINLTKKSGAGSLAHEWWHALDNYFARMGKKSLDFATDGTKVLDANVREEMKQAFTDIVDAIKKSELPKRSGELDKTRSKPYWATNVEMSARSFENYVIKALSEKGDSNDYLANFKELSDWTTVGSFEADSYPYPTQEESHYINEKFQQFFDTIQEKVDEETGNTILFRKVDEAGFYSTVEDALEKIKQEKGTPEQFKAMLLKNGAKQAELDWMDYDGTFTDKSITKADIQDWIEANRIEVREVEKGMIGRRPLEVVPNRFQSFDVVDTETGEEYLSNVSEARAYDFIENNEDTGTNTKFSQYTLPGGKNYKELLLTMPYMASINREEVSNRVDSINAELEELRGKGHSAERISELLNERDRLITELNNEAKSGFKSSHFDEPNILAHVRFNDRVVNGERVLFIEEIQSDWAQQGKKKGFDVKNKEERLKEIDELQKNGVEKYGVSEWLKSTEYQRLSEEYARIKDGISIPDMPFKKTDQWVNLALRRMMMYAAENDYDRIAWTTGEQQADRYDLSKQVDWIEYGKNENGTYWFTLPVEYSKPSELTEQELESYVGKDIAKKMIDGEGVDGELGGKRLKGNDLKIGGSGMIAFYDQIVPKAAKKLGKPFGADVEMIDIPEIGQQQSIPVTDALREIAPNGMPLFRKRDTEAREAYAMREWNRAKRAIDELAAKMGVSVEIIETTDGLPKAKAEAKGWYDTKSKNIAIVMPNHSNSWDAQATFLHEAVGHHGLRELFGEHFDTFLDNVYNNAEEGIKSQIDKKAQDKGWAVRKATEEYLSELAEDQEILQSDRLSGFFNSVKKFFFDMLAKIGFNPGFKLSNNELKYILWRSYQNLAEPGRYRSVVDQAKDVAMQYGLKVGNYEEKTPMANVAEEPGNDDIRYREKGDKKKLNNAEYIRLTKAYNNAKTLDEKSEAAELIIRGIERVIGDDLSYIAKTHEEFIRVIPSLTEEEKSSVRAGEVQGMFDGTMTHLDVAAIDTADELISTWFHENSHRVTKELFTYEELENFIDSISPNFEDLDYFLPKSYRENSKDSQANEFIARAIEYVIATNSLEDVVNNDIDYGKMPKQLRKFVETIFNTLQNEQLQKNGGDQRGIWEAGLSSRSSENNRGAGKNTGREDQEAFTGDRGGIRFKRRSLENDIRSAEGNPGEKLNTLFDNADNLSKVVPNYPDFLNRVLQNSPKKQEIFRDARERGWNNLDKAIESYMASVEDADELGRIRELLGVEVPDNAIRYLLWRNANPNDGSPRWIAEEALKRKELDENVLFRKGEVPPKKAMNEYEKRVKSRYNNWFRGVMFGIEEGWFDRMASLRILQNAITGNKAVPDKANAYMLENQLSSRNTSDIRYYNKNLIDPVIEQLRKVFGRDKLAADNYLNAKHGLERNVRMARQEADRWKENAMFELMKKELDDAEHEQAVRDIEELTEKKYNDNLKKDYSGLTALANEYDRKDFEEFARELVSEVENRIGKEEIDKLWNDINKATKWILDKQYNSGLMTKENYENIRNMYEYYVPLRGFAELTATDLYEYLQNPPSDFNGVLKTARGRTSKAESPVLSIMNMGESGIMQANRNRMKQAFYRLVATNPSNYASIEDVWLVKSGNDWQERFPKIDPNASGDEVADAIAEFNNEMAELAAKGEAVQGKNKLNVGVKILPAQASEHAIRVWVGGQEKVIYINGNPRAAQAINGLTQSNLIPREAARRSVEFWSRQMAANFTSRNPAFMITNFMRDVQFALISATVKEGGRYSAQLALNVTKVGKTIALNVWGKENTGNAEFQKYWDEFLANGGETGYANLHSIDQHRKYVNKKLREFSDQRDFLKPFREYTKFMENGNRMIEDMSRFATYVTSRQSGRSIERSVSDAKEITINFNRKGSGVFFANFIHSFYLFANPALQSMRLLGMMAKNHPVRFTAMLSSSMAMGTLVPFMNELLINLFGDDDDKDAYWNMAEWTRRNNLVLYMPGTKGKFVTLMLPHELRAFYGIGEIGYSYMNGRLRHQNMIAETAKQLTAMMPIDPFGGHDWWVPDVGKPLYQAHHKVNRNFMDRPIYKDTPWNKLDPEWTKAYKSTPSVLVEAAKWINEQSGGDEVVGGKVNLNPARAYHIFSGYMGGFLTTYTDLANVGFNLLTGRDVSLNDVPVGNKLIRTSDEKTAEMKLNSEYFYYLDWMRDYEHAQSGYKKRAQEKDYRDKYIKLRRSNEGSIYRYAKNMRDAIDKLQGVNEEKAMELKKEFVEKMWEYEGG